MKTSETVAAILPALYKAQAALKNIVPDAENPHFRSSYATLEAVLDHIRAVAHECGLAVVQSVGTGQSGPIVTTRIWHPDSGEWIEDALEIPAPGDAQKWGSAITYGRRYSIPPLFLIATEDDDDANAASAPPKRPATKSEPKAAQQAPNQAGGEPAPVEGTVAAITEKFAPRIGIKIGDDWYNTEDHDIVTALKIAKEDSHHVMFSWKWRQVGERRNKYITRLTIFGQDGEILQEIEEGRG